MSEAIETTEATVAENAPVEEASTAEAAPEAVQPQVNDAAPSQVNDVAESVEAPVEARFSDSLSEDLRDQKALHDFKDVDGLAKSYLHLNSMIGKKIGELSPEELGDVYNKLGRPEKSEEYALPDKVNDQFKGWYTESAHKLGLTQDQARGLAESYLELENAQVADHNANIEAQQAEWAESLKTEFGNAFDQRVGAAQKAVEAFGGAELKEAMDSTGLGNHPAMVKAFAQIGKEMLESGLTQSEASATFGVTPEDAKNKIANLKRDPEFMKAYMSGSHPGHAGAVAELQSYHAILHGKAT
jgi:hypothetical protein